MNRIKILPVSPLILVELFRIDSDKTPIRITGLPADATIVGVSDRTHSDRDLIAFKVASAEFPEVPSGEAVPELHLDVHDLRPMPGFIIVDIGVT